MWPKDLKNNKTTKVKILGNIIFMKYKLCFICRSIFFYASYDFIYDDSLTLMQGVTPPPPLPQINIHLTSNVRISKQTAQLIYWKKMFVVNVV